MAEGETLWGIARRYDVTVDAVREANDLSASEAIQPGRTLRIPRAASAAAGSAETRTAAAGSSATGTRASGTAATRASGEARPASGSSSTATRPAAAGTGRASTPAASGSAARSGASRTAARQHTVADGETLWAIARRYEITVDALRRANDLGENAAIQPGQRLTIPAN